MVSFRAVATAAIGLPRFAATRLASALLGDPSVVGGSLARLAGARIETKITDQICGIFETTHITDGGCNARRYRHVDARQRHQPPYDRVGHGGPRDVGFHVLE
jgi:hypothetical protein